MIAFIKKSTVEIRNAMIKFSTISREIIPGTQPISSKLAIPQIPDSSPDFGQTTVRRPL